LTVANLVYFIHSIFRSYLGSVIMHNVRPVWVYLTAQALEYTIENMPYFGNDAAITAKHTPKLPWALLTGYLRIPELGSPL
jgi:hypothetical protein